MDNGNKETIKEEMKKGRIRNDGKVNRNGTMLDNNILFSHFAKYNLSFISSKENTTPKQIYLSLGRGVYRDHDIPTSPGQ